jgi:hypothetical protein
MFRDGLLSKKAVAVWQISELKLIDLLVLETQSVFLWRTN